VTHEPDHPSKRIRPDPCRVLDALLDAHPTAVVAALAAEGGLVPLPSSVVLRGQRPIEAGTAIDVIVPEDQVRVIDAWRRAAEEPVVSLEVRLLADPSSPVRLHFLDVREAHRTHLAVLEVDDPELARRSIEARDGQRRRAAHVERDALGVLLSVDEATTDLLGWTEEQLLGRQSIELVHGDDVERALESWMAMRSGAGSPRIRVRYRHADGHHLWLEVTNDNRLDDPAVGRVLSELVDVSEDMAQLEDLRARERLLAGLAEALPIGVCQIRADGVVAYANAPMTELLGPVGDRRDLVRRVGFGDQALVAAALDASLQGRPSDLEVDVPHADGARRCELTFRPLAEDGNGADGGVIICAADVTARSRLQTELQHRADHDTLSGCLNRAATIRALEEALRTAPQVAVAFIDVDQLKVVNDVLGHAAGDALLSVAAGRLRRAIRAGDRLGRIGGDEFAVICPLRSGPVEAAELATRLDAAVNGDVWVADNRVHLAASVGLAVSRPGDDDAEGVLGRADAAMYAVKRERAIARDTSGLPFRPTREDRTHVHR
jgi:diguanylate cyclase (GGDEF)-like protein/PAS domain S-box-containing protein